MTEPTPPREESLLERAARIYDFRQHAQMRGLPIAPDVPAPPVPPPAPVMPVAPVQSVEPPAAEVPVEPLAFAPPAVPALPALPILDPSGFDLSAIPAEFLASADDDFDDFVPPAPPSGVISIDRGMLAENGMIVPGAPIGPLAEEFRLIKRQLFITRARVAESHQAAKARTVLVCSARPGDGKTFCSINLALSIAAERDTEVLLVDADFIKADVLARLGLVEGIGLLDALAHSSIDVEELVLTTDVPNLSILPAGTKTASDTELLGSARTRTVIARLLDANPRRLIIFDSPPVLAASPASVLAMMVGQVMLVVRADRTPEGELAAAVNLLDGCDHIQLVLNAVSFVPGGARFGSYYGQETRK